MQLILFAGVLVKYCLCLPWRLFIFLLLWIFFLVFQCSLWYLKWPKKFQTPTNISQKISYLNKKKEKFSYPGQILSVPVYGIPNDSSLNSCEICENAVGPASLSTLLYDMLHCMRMKNSSSGGLAENWKVQSKKWGRSGQKLWKLGRSGGKQGRSSDT